MQKETFINEMKARGYEIKTVNNGKVIARKGDATVRWVALADYGVYIATPTVKAITKEHATDAENLRIIDGLTA
jgi:hypothetical protein|nr:MAG TPA: hypothetical protein [Caudoviricetes sp.]